MSLNIVIIGAGEVGFNIAKHLSKEDYSISVIDINLKNVKEYKIQSMQKLLREMELLKDYLLR